MNDVQNNWYAPLEDCISLGVQKKKIRPKGQSTHQTKKQFQGQYFTPNEVAQFMWRFVADLPVKNLLDNSIGSARLLQYADPKKHYVFGVDVNKDTIDAVMNTFSVAGFNGEIMHAGMQNINPINMCAALINPPFGLTIDSSGLYVYEGVNRRGPLGNNTRVTSHEYAVAQALTASKIVIALLPLSCSGKIKNQEGFWGTALVSERVRAVLELPDKSFEKEGTNIGTAIVVFGEVRDVFDVHFEKIKNFDDFKEDFDLHEALDTPPGEANLGFKDLDVLYPSIHLPVNGDNRVWLSLDGRRIKLKFKCGFAQARVLNALYMRRIVSDEYIKLPDGFIYEGQGKIDLEVYLAQSNPKQAFDQLIKQIESENVEVIIDKGVYPTLLKKIKQSERAKTPFRRDVLMKGEMLVDGKFTAISRKKQTANPKLMLSPLIQEGESINFQKLSNGLFQFEKKDKLFEITEEELGQRFAIPSLSDEWKTVFPGLLEKFPNHANILKKRLVRLGIDQWLSWDFQIDDCIELTMKPLGAIGGWQQACGKSRLAAALIILSDMKHGLIVVESRLVEEMKNQLLKINIYQDQINVIDGPTKLNCLKQFNLISYERLRSIVDPSQSVNATYARRLRRRIGILLADEGERLSNLTSAQSEALFNVSPKKRYVLTGTPIANYPRDIHGLTVYTSGDGTANQPYGYHRGFLEDNWINSVAYAVKGIRQLTEDFVTLDWATHEFLDSLQKGAKREIPKIKNPEKFRTWLSPIIKRRLTAEPEVARHINLKKPVINTVNLDWEPSHLAYYLTVADDFANWYQNAGSEKNNLATVMVKLQAIQIALNAPQMGVGQLKPFKGVTSKQKYDLDLIQSLTEKKKKIIFFAENPFTVDFFHAQLSLRGIDSVKFHGKIPMAKRISDKDEFFVKGDVPVLLMTKSSGKAGYNLPMANEVIFYDRSWSAKSEAQALARALRTENKFQVNATFTHIRGSIDEYQAQMVSFKDNAASSGLDWNQDAMSEEKFLHIDQIIWKFVTELAKLRGKENFKMREELKRNLGDYKKEQLCLEHL